MIKTTTKTKKSLQTRLIFKQDKRKRDRQTDRQTDRDRKQEK